ncbi:MAG: endonuclease III [Nitrososphaerota archaeon]|jgi:endonuclease-3|uniref:endonuclease III domain-containing protein n=1 Tax=Candidatus Bathycorpusculum sp. TaxID=2994959 RepID=UPI00282643FA|nr:endonuclease III [Candidatus Termiticorpusculum sp.]MCL2257992.1 endonuclease III [Candidatus Termiticorpusculum sp.]MCL2291825.1 endonuclease III [Candidatus Termiticorpusculum sp.]MDR0459938.1 endonuclease III [Nitrososphaerota archaeon]
MLVTAQVKEILTTLKQTVVVPSLVKAKSDPFETLIVTIISQNTADKNTDVAFTRLKQCFQITPKILSDANSVQIEECIKPAGLYKNKTCTIQAVSKIVHEKYGGSLHTILTLPLEEARKIFIKMPGVGPKTADVVLLFSAQKPTIPIDTHVNRVSKRLGLAPKKGNYETVRQSLQKIFDETDYLIAHQLLIGHGRKFCKAHKPLCNICPIISYCETKGDRF